MEVALSSGRLLLNTAERKCARSAPARQGRNITNDALTAYVSKNEYDRIAVKVNVSLLGLLTSEVAPMENVSYSEEFIYTIYNGKCKLFIVHDELPVKQYLTFHYPRHEPYQMFILQPHEKFFMIWQQWIYSIVPNIEIRTHDIDIEINRIRRVLFSKPNRKCSNGVRMTDFVGCLKQELLHDFHFFNFDCVPIHLKENLDFRGNIRDCNENDPAMHGFSQLATEKLSSYVNWNSSMKCSMPCELNAFSAESIKLQNLERQIPLTNGLIYVCYSTHLIKAYSEYYIYDFTAMVASIGGGLGMFLGVSCLGMTSYVFKMIFKSE